MTAGTLLERFGGWRANCRTRTSPASSGDHRRLPLTGMLEVPRTGGTVTCRPAFDLLAMRCRDTRTSVAEAITGLPAAAIERAAQVLCESRPVAFYTCPQVELHPGTADVRGIAEGDWVEIATPEGCVRARAAFNRTLDPGVVCGQHGRAALHARSSVCPAILRSVRAVRTSTWCSARRPATRSAAVHRYAPRSARSRGSRTSSSPASSHPDAIERPRWLGGARERVYGDPVEKDGITVLPAATVTGGGGGGGGRNDEGPESEGGGFGVGLKPAGVYIITDGHVRWRPAIDANRLIASITAVALAAMLTRVRL